MFHYVIFRYRSNVLRNVLYQYHNSYKRSSYCHETHPHLGPRPRNVGHGHAQKELRYICILAKESSIWSILIQCNRFFR